MVIQDGEVQCFNVNNEMFLDLSINDELNKGVGCAMKHNLHSVDFYSNLHYTCTHQELLSSQVGKGLTSEDLKPGANV